MDVSASCVVFVKRTSYGVIVPIAAVDTFG